MALVRLNISASEDVKEWYQEQAKEYGMSMSALMSFVLTQYKKGEESKELLKNLNDMSKGMDTGKMVDELKSLMNAFESNNLVNIEEKDKK